MPEPETVAGPIHIASKGVCADRAPIDQMRWNSKVVRETPPHNTLVIRFLANSTRNGLW